ncbi:serine hydrolase [uncultured Friedmanniella sp.]|uniref:serine hydrolase n=1 Tax=uncultured Friedmanniella sp. TaxID=335381 RepID=UPI0035CCA315
MTLLTPDRPRTADRRPPARPVRRTTEIVRPTRTGDRARLAVAVVVTVVALVVLAVHGPPLTPEAPPAEQQAPPAAPGLEAQLKAYLTGRPTTAAVEVRDLTTGQEYGYRATKAYDSASVVKIAILAATLRHAEQQQRGPTAKEKSLLSRMIRLSDNGAATTLWNRLGRGDTFDEFFAAAGMTHTTAGPRGYWGLTRVTAADQVVLMAHLTQPSPLLSQESRDYARGLMAKVDHDQDWGVSAGPGQDDTVELKNGWLPRGTHGWAVHSVGHVQGDGRDYLIAVLTVDNPTEKKGITTVEGASKIVWRALAPA